MCCLQCHDKFSYNGYLFVCIFSIFLICTIHVLYILFCLSRLSTQRFAISHKHACYILRTQNERFIQKELSYRVYRLLETIVFLNFPAFPHDIPDVCVCVWYLISYNLILLIMYTTYYLLHCLDKHNVAS